MVVTSGKAWVTATTHRALVSSQCIPSAIVSFAVSRRNVNAVSPALVQSAMWGQPPASRAVEATDPGPWVGLTAHACKRV